MRLYVVGGLRGGSEIVVSQDAAAWVTTLDEAEIEWTLQEYRICETDEHVTYDRDGLLPAIVKNW